MERIEYRKPKGQAAALSQPPILIHPVVAVLLVRL
jgi:hypothetical protein